MILVVKVHHAPRHIMRADDFNSHEEEPWGRNTYAARQHAAANQPYTNGVSRTQQRVGA